MICGKGDGRCHLGYEHVVNIMPNLYGRLRSHEIYELVFRVSNPICKWNYRRVYRG